MNGEEILAAGHAYTAAMIDEQIEEAVTPLRDIIVVRDQEIGQLLESAAQDHASIESLRSRLGDADIQHVNDLAIIDELRAEVAELKAQLPDPPKAMIFGQNLPITTTTTNTYLPSGETEQQVIDRVLATYGRLPMSKAFYSGSQIPQTWQPNREGRQPEKRIVICYDAGTPDGNLAAHAASVPDGWWVIYCPFQEGNDDIGSSLPLATFHGMFTRGRPIIKQAEKPGNQLDIASCFTTAYGKNADQLASYIPPDGSFDMHLWDTYINPAGQGGTGYASQYKPDPAARLAANFAVNKMRNIKRTGIGEFGAPLRSWDTGGVERDKVLTAFVEIVKAGYDLADGSHVTPEFCLLFNQQGTQWDQRVTAPPLGKAEKFVQTWHDYVQSSG